MIFLSHGIKVLYPWDVDVPGYNGYYERNFTLYKLNLIKNVPDYIFNVNNENIHFCHSRLLKNLFLNVLLVQ